MTIEESIKQSKVFDSVFLKLLVNILYTGVRVEIQQEEFFKQFNLTSQQYNTLRILRGRFPEGWPVGEVQKRMVSPNSNVTRIADRLLDKKFITRVENPDNRRYQILTITEIGLDLMAHIDTQMNESLAMVSRLSPEEATTMNALLDKIRS